MVVHVKSYARRLDTAVRRGNDPVWRYVFNLPGYRHFRAHPPVLNAASAQAIEDLRSSGVARTTLEDVTGDPHLLATIQEHAAVLEQQREAEDAARSDGAPVTRRPFLVEMLDPFRPVVDPTGVLAQVALNPGIKGIVDTYLGLTSKVSDINVWRNQPTAASSAAATQLWHRDLAEDRHLVKVFLYLAPTPLEAGPFVFSRGSHHQKGTDEERQAMFHDGINYRMTDKVKAAELERQAEICTGPAGALIFADVRGFHRGGFSTTQTRLLMQMRYSSATALRDKQLKPPAGVHPREWRRHLSYARPGFKTRLSSPPTRPASMAPNGS
jgi:hypothetical protein